MTAVFKRPGSNFYYGRILAHGRQRWFSTKKTNRKEAQDFVNAKLQAVQGKGLVEDHLTGLIAIIAQLPKNEQDAVRHDLARRLMRGQSATLPITHAWQAWLDSPLKGNPSAITIRDYKSTWNRLSKWIEGRELKFLHEITEAHAQDYIADLWKSNVSPQTFNGHVKFLKSMFKVLRVKAGLVSNVWGNIKLMEKETQGRHNFTPDELATICSQAREPIRYMIGIGLYTGLRLGDVVNLKWTNIGNNCIKLMPAKTKRKGKTVTLPIHPVLQSLLDELRQQTGASEYLFPEEHATYQTSRPEVSRRFQNYLKSCGIVTTEPGGPHRRKAIVRKGFHSLRHSFVSLCAANRVPQVAIQELVGHGSPAMTALYSHADFEQKQKAITSLPAMAFDRGSDAGTQPQEDA